MSTPSPLNYAPAPADELPACRPADHDERVPAGVCQFVSLVRTGSVESNTSSLLAGQMPDLFSADWADCNSGRERFVSFSISHGSFSSRTMVEIL